MKDEGGGMKDDDGEADELLPSPSGRGAGGEGGPDSSFILQPSSFSQASSRGGFYAWIEGGYMVLLRFRWGIAGWSS